MRVSILDYGVGNVHSLAKAITAAGGEPRVERDVRVAMKADALVLPGVGAFSPAAECLAPARSVLRDTILGGFPTLGICLGMQLLFDASDEGPGAGLGVFEGRVTRLRARAVPQIGWNAVDGTEDPFIRGSALREAYYANSYACRPHDASVVWAWTDHDGDRFPAVVRRGRTLGVQFHPEKSSRPGVAFIRAFLSEVAA
ncbi:MAG: imidazole glycerol phosphate synthase subunit HisH [Gemmatimonadaceae bacterium]|nr:imidazole glycerol phosphate synthase subunit HisH [Gemmatimonadaceae bacterium]